MHLLLNLLVLVATVLGSWMAFPQARRIARTRRVDGVSVTWIGVSLAINAWWLSYGLVAGVWALVPVSTISLLLYGVMAWFFVLSVGRDAIARARARGVRTRDGAAAVPGDRRLGTRRCRRRALVRDPVAPCRRRVAAYVGAVGSVVDDLDHRRGRVDPVVGLRRRRRRRRARRWPASSAWSWRR